jgi:hypothetical protein
MHTRNTSWILAVLAVAAVWVLPSEVQASDWLVRKQFAVDDSEPEVPNIVAPREPDQVVVEKSVGENRRIVASPVDRSQNLLLRLLRIMRSLNFGGPAR